MRNINIVTVGQDTTGSIKASKSNIVNDIKVKQKFTP